VHGGEPTKNVETVTAPVDGGGATVQMPPSSGDQEGLSQPPLPEERVEEQPKDQEWPLKTVIWPPFSNAPREVKILMQDLNGPCSFLALCNVLLVSHASAQPTSHHELTRCQLQLRGDIHLSSALKSVKYSTLASLVADYFLRTNADATGSSTNATLDSLDFALNVLPKTLSGLDVNIDFLTGGFSAPEGVTTVSGELELFNQARVDIRHGWIVSKDDKDVYEVLSEGNITSYDQAVNRLVEGDEIAGGTVTGGNQGEGGDEAMDKLFADLSEHPEKQAKVHQGQYRETAVLASGADPPDL